VPRTIGSPDPSSPPGWIGSIAGAACVAAALVAAGCGTSGPPEFRLNSEGRDPQQISLTQQEAITEALAELFGTPDDPRPPEGVELDPALLGMAAGPIARSKDEAGRPLVQRGRYRQHCAVCHGLSGDGAGPLALLFDPYPRDFRRGLFKYTSTRAGAKPTRDDLDRMLRQGMPDTGMPSYDALTQPERDALVEYVRYLSIRGETELFLFQLVVDEDEYLPLKLEWVMDDGVQPAAESWATPESDQQRYVVEPPPEPQETPQQRAASIAKGRELFLGKESQCAMCHGPEGDGRGELDELYDDWNKPKKGVIPEQTDELARLFTLPVQRLRARDFTRGTFHGGDRSIDLYWRVHVGIKGTPMPAGGPAMGASGVFEPEEIWDVVHYIRSLSE